MKTIGQIINIARKNKGYSFEKLEEITKIKSSFIKLLEEENWQELPSFPTVLGFVKSISEALEIDEKMAIAVLKRDFSIKKTSINPKPDILNKPAWGPKLTFILGIGLIILLVAGYLIFQYVNFISPPKIDVTSPIDGQIISGGSVLVFGSTDTDAKITVDNQPVLVDEDGKFSVNIDVAKDTNEIVIVAQSRNGKTTTISRKIQIEQ